MKENKFWEWFVDNNNDYLNLDVIDESRKEILLDNFLAHLHKYCEEIYFQISNNSKVGNNELVITAEGNSSFFIDVERLVSSAPSLSNWKIIAFKQPKEEMFVTEYEGLVLDPKKIWFLPLESQRNPAMVGIRVCLNNVDEMKIDQIKRGVKQLLDALLGEKDYNKLIDYFEVGNLMNYDVDKDGLIELVELREYLNWKKS